MGNVAGTTTEAGGVTAKVLTHGGTTGDAIGYVANELAVFGLAIESDKFSDMDPEFAVLTLMGIEYRLEAIGKLVQDERLQFFAAISKLEAECEAKDTRLAELEATKASTSTSRQLRAKPVRSTIARKAGAR